MFNDRCANEKSQDRPRNKCYKNCFLEILRHVLIYNLHGARSRSESFLFLPQKLAECLAQEMHQMNKTESDCLNREEHLVHKQIRPLVTLPL